MFYFIILDHKDPKYMQVMERSEKFTLINNDVTYGLCMVKLSYDSCKTYFQKSSF